MQREKWNEYQNKYAKEHYKRYSIVFNKEKDKDIIEFLDNCPNKTKWIRDLIGHTPKVK